MSVSQRTRRWFRFGLRSLLIVVTVLAVVLGILVRSHSEGLRHQRIAQELISFRNGVQFSHYRPVPTKTVSPALGMRDSAMESTLPWWVERWGLAPVFRRIESVRIYPSAHLPQTLGLLKELGSADSVSFRDVDVGYEQLSDTFHGVHVRKLEINFVTLPRTGMPWLRQSNLKWLSVVGTQFSNSAIDDLPDSLVYLDATGTRIDDEGLAKFLRLKNLKTLDLSRTPTTRGGFERLSAQMPWCQVHWGR